MHQNIPTHDPRRTANLQGPMGADRFPTVPPDRMPFYILAGAVMWAAVAQFSGDYRMQKATTPILAAGIAGAIGYASGYKSPRVV